jgi:hypothetical protein
LLSPARASALAWERPSSERALASLVEAIRAAAGELTVLDEGLYQAWVDQDARALVQRIQGVPETSEIRAAFAEFEALHPGRGGEARSKFFEVDATIRTRWLAGASDTDTRARQLVDAAVDYGILESLTLDETKGRVSSRLGLPHRRRHDEGATPHEERFRELRGGKSYEAAYKRLLNAVAAVDPVAADRAPRVPTRLAEAEPFIRTAEVVSLVLPAITGVLADRVVDAAVSWLARRSSRASKRKVRIYGPDGDVLREIDVAMTRRPSTTYDPEILGEVLNELLEERPPPDADPPK